MKHFNSSSFGMSAGWIVVPIGVIASAVYVIGKSLHAPARIDAAVDLSRDSDGDGLVDRQELILGTSTVLVDTDNDGYSDTEELARRSSPLATQWRPSADRVSVGMSAYGDNGKLHGTIAVYFTNTNYRDLNMELGVQLGQRLVDLERHQLIQSGSVTFVPATDSAAMIGVIDIEIPPQWVYHFQELTFFTTVARPGTGLAMDADKLQLIHLDEVITLVQPSPVFIANTNLSAPTHAAQSSGSVYRPLPLDDEGVPPTWTLDQICSQRSAPMGVSGPVITQEVTSAECQSGWDSACPPSCASSVGSTHTTIDPMILIGH